MYKEIIVCILVVILIFSMDLLSNNYTKKVFFSINDSLGNLRNEMLKEDKDVNKINDEITKVEQLYLKINLQSNNLIIMRFITVILSTILSIVFAKNMIDKDEGRYGINMEYSNNTRYEIYLNCIINLKFIHIISVMCESFKIKRADKNARKSYRRAYEYNHE